MATYILQLGQQSIGLGWTLKRSALFEVDLREHAIIHQIASTVCTDTSETSSININSKRLCQLRATVGQEFDLSGSIDGLLKDIHYKGVVDSKTDDIVNALRLELIRGLDPERDVTVQAGAGECAGDGNDGDLFRFENVGCGYGGRGTIFQDHEVEVHGHLVALGQGHAGAGGMEEAAGARDGGAGEGGQSVSDERHSEMNCRESEREKGR